MTDYDAAVKADMKSGFTTCTRGRRSGDGLVGGIYAKAFSVPSDLDI
jgi:hypothetical protein